MAKRRPARTSPEPAPVAAELLQEPTTTDYGADYWADRSYEAQDPEGHRFYFSQRVRNHGEPPLPGVPHEPARDL